MKTPNLVQLLRAKSSAAYVEVQGTELTMEAMLETMNLNGRPALRSSEIFDGLWRCSTKLQSKRPGVTGEVEGERCATPYEAVKSCYDRYKDLIP